MCHGSRTIFQTSSYHGLRTQIHETPPHPLYLLTKSSRIPGNVQHVSAGSSQQAYISCCNSVHQMDEQEVTPRHSMFENIATCPLKSAMQSSFSFRVRLADESLFQKVSIGCVAETCTFNMNFFVMSVTRPFCVLPKRNPKVWKISKSSMPIEAFPCKTSKCFSMPETTACAKLLFSTNLAKSVQHWAKRC